MEHKDYRLAAIMFTDIVGFSKMMETDETRTLEMLREHNQLITNLAAEYKGTVIKTIGDAFLVDFPNTVNAVKCAVAVQEQIAGINENHPQSPLALRIGVHLGDIYFFEDDALGEGINIASRLQSLGKPGRVCISQDVYNLVANKLDKRFVHLGQVKLKNITREINAYEIVVGVDDVVDEAAAEPARGSSDSAAGAPSRPVQAASVPASGEPDFAELKRMVLGEIKRAGRRLRIDEIRSRLPTTSKRVDEVLEQLADRGFLIRLRRPQGNDAYASMPTEVPFDMPDRRGVRDDHSEDKEIERRWDRALREERTSPSEYDDRPDPLVREYREQTVSAAEQAKAGVRGHLGAFVGVQAMLFVIWLTTGAGFPWFLIPLFAWGIGIASHLGSVRRRVREAQDLTEMGDINREQLRIYRKLVKARDSWGGHLISSVATSALLLIINLITTGFPWAIFPIGGMAIGLFSHFPSFKTKERRLLAQLKEAGVRVGRFFRRGKGGQGEAAPLRLAGPAEEAHRLKESILRQIESMGEGEAPVGEDIVPVLDNYVGQIEELSRKDRELEELIRSIPMRNLERDMAQLEERRAAAADQRVLAEYDRSIAQIQKQQESFRELQNEKEMLRLRLTTSVNSLKQMQIDLARMRSLSSGTEPASLGLLKDKSEELSQYLEDLRKGYEELD